MKNPYHVSLISTFLANGEGLRREHYRGFTLLEVLVSFAITALALGVLYQIYAKGAATAVLGEEYAEAVSIAESRLALIGMKEELVNTTSSGNENEKYEWRITVQDYVPAVSETSNLEPPLVLKAIELEITWESLGKQRSLVLRTLRPAPPVL
jgi:general secretion pathway protein I